MDLTMRIAISVLVGFALTGLVWFGWGLVANLRTPAEPTESSDENGDEEDS
jgi:hypothetical protein